MSSTSTPSTPSPPKLSPKNSPTHSPSPKRRPPLHERTNSQTNRLSTSSLRMVEESDARIYATSPFPSKPAHILSPYGEVGQGYGFGEENTVSDNTKLRLDATPSEGHPNSE